jgi:hypothetical protein
VWVAEEEARRPVPGEVEVAAEFFADLVVRKEECGVSIVRPAERFGWEGGEGCERDYGWICNAEEVGVVVGGDDGLVLVRQAGEGCAIVAVSTLRVSVKALRNGKRRRCSAIIL